MSGTTNETEDTLHVLSLNCWGIKYFSRKRRERISSIGDRLADSDYNIVALQELWSPDDYDRIRHKIKHKLPYAQYYYAGAFGAGLALFSRWPIIEASMTPYPLNGRPTAFWRGDWYVGKGIAQGTILHPSGWSIEVMTTHLHAPYGKGEDTYYSHRVAQAWEISKRLRAAVDRGNIVLVAGDFNFVPGSLPYRLITAYGKVEDCWGSVHPDVIGCERGKLDDRGLIDKLGVTCDSRLNTWRAHVSARDMDDYEAKRLDYVFKSPSRIHVESSTIVFTDPVDGVGCSMSDHFGVRVDLRIGQGEETISSNSIVSKSDLEHVRATTVEYMDRERRHMAWRMVHLCATIPALVAFHVAVFWVRHLWAAFILMLACTLASIAGVLHGLVIGFLFGRWEMRGLIQFLGEIESLEAAIGSGVIGEDNRKNQNNSPDRGIMS